MEDEWTSDLLKAATLCTSFLRLYELLGGHSNVIHELLQQGLHLECAQGIRRAADDSGQSHQIAILLVDVCVRKFVLLPRIEN